MGTKIMMHGITSVEHHKLPQPDLSSLTITGSDGAEVCILTEDALAQAIASAWQDASHRNRALNPEAA